MLAYENFDRKLLMLDRPRVSPWKIEIISLDERNDLLLRSEKLVIRMESREATFNLAVLLLSNPAL